VSIAAGTRTAVTGTVTTGTSAAGTAPADIAWVKGHGTRNDFVLLDDPDGTIFGELDPQLVRHICDRRGGVGADGVLRVIRTSAMPGLGPQTQLPGAEWFMDYRNADGSLAQMCGNGVRVFAQYLLATGRAAPGEPVAVGTRSGVRTAHPQPHDPATGPVDPGRGWWAVDMGVAELAAQRDPVLRVSTGPDQPARDAVAVDVGNPHAVVVLDDVAAAGPLIQAPSISPPDAFPDGVNVEFVTRIGPRSFQMRVFERGAGETPSCGTGICAAAAVLYATDRPPGAARHDPVPYQVDVPGGQLIVTVTDAGPNRFAVGLAGPAVLVGEGRLSCLS